jgi:transcriptional regulator with XRE-family HTH domain
MNIAPIVERIYERRLKRGMSQAEAAWRAGVSQPYWAMVESGAKVPSVTQLAKLAKAVGLKVEVKVK